MPKGQIAWNKKSPIIKQCFLCKKVFYTKEHIIKNGGGKFCSQKCYWINMKGKAPATAWKKGHITWNKGKKCPQNSGKNHPSWKGGIINKRGYIYILKKDHPACDKMGYVMRAKIILGEHLGRIITKEESIHHINRIKDDDRPENLMIFPNLREHNRFHMKQLWNQIKLSP